MDMVEGLEEGKTYLIECLDGKTRTVHLKRAICEYRGGILYLEDFDGKVYNWGVVIWIQEA